MPNIRKIKCLKLLKSYNIPIFKYRIKPLLVGGTFPIPPYKIDILQNNIYLDSLCLT